ncbi:MAG: rRNA adenine N-6-methyltransferase family protein, partial [Bacteriovoracaceae bacterium]
LPYNVSSQLFIQFLQVPQISNMTLMYQKEVGEKTYMRQNAKNQSNSLLSLSRVYTQSKLVAKVHPGAFHPPPKVESVVVSYWRKSDPAVKLEEFQELERFLRGLFSFKRKQLGSVLKSFSQGKKLAQSLQQTGFNLQVRAESLSLDEILEAYKVFKQLV